MHPFASLAFSGTWRDYQARVLEELDAHLGDARLHVVAAPGSGKTVLGLEVMRRIGRPAIVLAPSIAIRNQWVERLRAMFVPPGAAPPDWISTAIASPRPLTVITYQALHAAMGEAEEAEEMADDTVEAEWAPPGSFAALAAFYRGLGPATLLLDEAHHLRREWWRALTALQAALGEPRVVALTATPPYDVERVEWQRYEALCGEMDAEIPAAELVRNGDLCPHQDYLHLSLPTASEGELFAAHREGIAALVSALHADRDLLALILAHPWLTDPDAHEEALFEAPESLSAMIVFAAFTGAAAPARPLALLGVGRSEIPPMSLDWLERLLDFMLFARPEDFAAGEERLKALKAELRRLGLIEGRRVKLREDRHFYATLAGSLAKIGSIVAIAEAESAALGEDLRLVVLADYVRAADMPRRPGDEVLPAKLGVVPIFEALRRRAAPGIRLGILTGSLVVVPAEAGSALSEAAARIGIPPSHIATRPLPHDPAFFRVEISGEAGERIVQLVTALFGAGHVNALVGTQALLGEGWDAPSVNTLVLASYVGSYMTSNQMRGRAIRIDPAEPAKAANIWHLGTVAPEGAGDWLLGRLVDDPFDPIGRDLGPDMAMLKRRFLAFEGVGALHYGRIETGLGRLGLADRHWTEADIEALNAEMLARAAERSSLGERSRTALGGAGTGARPRMHRALRTRHAPRTVAWLDTLRYLAITALLGGAFAGARAAVEQGWPGEVLTLILIFLGAASLYAVPRLLKALYLALRNGSLEGSLGQAGRAILDALDEAGLLSCARAYYQVETGRGALGEALVRLEGGNRADERLFLDALHELLGPVENPRYLLVRESWLGRRLRIDYHSVPAIFGRKKLAEAFAKAWRRYVGSAKLVYLRDAAGRRLLLRARTRSLAAGMSRAVGGISLWR